jgi:hypothetical protein
VTSNFELADATHQLAFGALHGKRCLGVGLSLGETLQFV